MSRELAFNKRVNAITDIPNDKTTMNRRRLLVVVSVSDRPTITGSSGRMHGASTVNIPAINEITRSNMLFYLCNQFCKGWTTAPFFNKVSIFINLNKSVLIGNSILFL